MNLDIELMLIVYSQCITLKFQLLYRCVQAINVSHDAVHAQMDVKLRSLVCLGLNEQVNQSSCFSCNLKFDKLQFHLFIYILIFLLYEIK